VPKPLTFGSLFAGIGGMDLGLERAGMQCKWQVEINPFSVAVLQKHWPEVPKYGDITKLTGYELERVDLIAGGFPCQDLSNAGSGRGITGSRSGLWKEYLRLVRILRPRFVLVENVAALLERGIDVVLGDLAESGYDCEWDCLPAGAVGAPHIRDRIFIVAHAERDGWQQNATGRNSEFMGLGACKALAEGKPKATVFIRSGEGIPIWGSPRQSRIPHADHRRQVDEWTELARFWATEPAVGRVVDGFSAGMDRIKACGNAVVPQVAEWIGRRIVEHACV
jgi:DNA (cytosine-5)-methyltransferase 1